MNTITEPVKPTELTELIPFFNQQPSITINLNEPDYYLTTSTPEKYDDELPPSVELKNHTYQNISNIKEYFEQLFRETEGFLMVLNGNVYKGDLICDFCRLDRGSFSHYCKKCGLDMCHFCYVRMVSETVQTDQDISEIEEDSETSDIIKPTEDLLGRINECKFHQNFIIKKDYNIVTRCDGCGTFSIHKTGVWYHNRDLNSDFCQDCQHLMKEGGSFYLRWFKRTVSPFNMLCWIPIYKDNDTHSLILYNVVPADNDYHKVALATYDNHGRMGFFIIPYTLDETLEKLKEKIVEYDDEFNNEETWDSHYNCPINLILIEEGHEIHYG